MLELNNENFKEEVEKRKLVLVDFYATWCGPCSIQSEILKKMSNSRSIDFDIVKINVDESPSLASEFRIDSIPTLMVFKEGQMSKRIVGLTDEEELLTIMEEFK